MIPLKPMMLLGMLAAVVPVLIHLFNRTRYRVEPFGAMMFLRSAARVRARGMRLREILLLTLRGLALILVAIAMARPVSPGFGAGGGKQPATQILIIDHSYSTQREDGGESAFREIVDSAFAILNTMDAADSMGIVLGGSRPQPLFPRATIDRAQLRRSLLTLEPGYESLNLAEALTQAFWMLEHSSQPRHRVIILSDHQAVHWELTPADWQRLQRHRDVLRVPPSIYVQGGGTADPLANLTPLKIAPRSPIVDTHRPAHFDITVRNRGPKSSGSLAVHVDGNLLREQELELISGDTLVPVSVSFREPGSHHISATVNGDTLTVDNSLTRAVDVLDKVEVLLVEGRSSANPLQADGALLRMALEATGSDEHEGLFEVSVRNQTELDSLGAAELSAYKVLVLANVHTLSQYAVFAIEQFVQQGGGLLVALGDGAEPSEYAKLYKDGQGLLPGTLRRRRTYEDAFFRPALVGEGAAHVLGPLAEELPRVFDNVHVRAYWSCTASPTSTVLATFGADPFLMHQRYGEGKVLLWSTAFDTAWSNFPLTPDFLPLVHTLVLHLAAGVRPPLNLSQLEPLLVVSPSTGNVRPGCRITLPNGAAHPIELRREGDHWAGQWSDTRQPGLYTLNVGEEAPRHYAVGLNTDEGDLTPLDDSLREQAQS
ncbi:MAG: hypothetical protein ACI8W8_001926, partial [Rhodothermales bacterium]